MNDKMDATVGKIYEWISENMIVINGNQAVSAMEASVIGLLSELSNRIENGTAEYDDYEAVCAMLLAMLVVSDFVNDEGAENVVLDVSMDDDE